MTSLENIIAQIDNNVVHNYVLLFMLIFTRWLALSIMTPLFGALLLPSLVRIGFAALMSVVSILVVHNSVYVPDINIFIITALFIKEAIIGFIMGFFVSLLFFAYELTGQLIDSARGANMARMLVPELRTQSSPMGTLLFQFALVIFFALGLHRDFIRSIFKSFEQFPVFSLSAGTNMFDSLQLVTHILGALLSLALQLSLPVLFLCFLIDSAFGLLNRVAPQINAYFLSLPAKIIAGLIMLFFCLPFLLDDFIQHKEGLGVFLVSFMQ